MKIMRYGILITVSNGGTFCIYIQKTHFSYTVTQDLRVCVCEREREREGGGGVF